MDSRLSYLSAQRPSRLRRQDLPNVAMAMTAYIRGLQTTVSREGITGLHWVTFRSPTFTVSVLSEDWEKIDPYLRDDMFSPLKYPVAAGYALLNPAASITLSAIQTDPLYSRILFVLNKLFPESYPDPTY